MPPRKGRKATRIQQTIIAALQDGPLSPAEVAALIPGIAAHQIRRAMVAMVHKGLLVREEAAEWRRSGGSGGEPGSGGSSGQAGTRRRGAVYRLQSAEGLDLPPVVEMTVKVCLPIEDIARLEELARELGVSRRSLAAEVMRRGMEGMEGMEGERETL